MGLIKFMIAATLLCILPVWGRQQMPLVNPGFEEGMLGWNPDGSGRTLFLETAAHAGTMGVRMANKASEDGCSLQSEPLAATAQHGYELVFMGRTDGQAEHVTFSLKFFDRQGKQLESPAGGWNFSMGNVWQRYSCTDIAPRGTVTLRLDIHIRQGEEARVEVDDLAVMRLNEEETRVAAEALRRKAARKHRAVPPPKRRVRVAYEDLAQRMRLVEIANHPRLLVSTPGFESLRHAIADGGEMHVLMYGRLEFLANALLTVPVLKHRLEQGSLLEVAQTALFRIATLALCYRISGRPAYRERCLAELRAVSRFPDWNPTHFLAVSEMTLGVATGYDWLYDDLADDDRALIAGAILEKGLKASGPDARWRSATDYWGQVCHGGMLAGALAVCELDPERCRRQMYESIRALEAPMRAYAPRGSYPWGPGYWTYGTGYAVLALSMLSQAFGTDFGLSELPGFQETGRYQDYLVGPSGLVFNYGGSLREGRSRYGIPWWFARRFEMPGGMALERSWFASLCRDRRPVDMVRYNGWIFPYALLWLDEHGGEEEPLPLVWNGGGEEPVAVLRSGWKPTDTYVGVKGGSSGGRHGHMDCGSFVVDAGGVRWLENLGAESSPATTSLGLDLDEGQLPPEQWNQFRLNSLRYNTLALDGRQQRNAGKVPIECHEEGKAHVAVLDLTRAYGEACKKAVRRIRLEQDGTVMVQDELEGLRPGCAVRWGVGTFQQVRGGSGRQILLAGQGTCFVLENLGPESWQVVEARIPQSLPKGNAEKIGFKRLELHRVAPGDGKLSLRVRMGLRK